VLCTGAILLSYMAAIQQIEVFVKVTLFIIGIFPFDNMVAGSEEGCILFEAVVRLILTDI
jgi:hypothetical protein